MSNGCPTSRSNGPEARVARLPAAERNVIRTGEPSNDPFDSSQDLACWAASVLAAARVDGIADWRMLERWAQVELYRALRTGEARRREYLGDYEQPYNTDQPICRQTPQKWADLVCLAVQPRCKWLDQVAQDRWLAEHRRRAQPAGGDLIGGSEMTRLRQ